MRLFGSFRKLGLPYFGVLYNKDPTIFYGTILGAGKLPFKQKRVLVSLAVELRLGAIMNYLDIYPGFYSTVPRLRLLKLRASKQHS